MSNKNIDKIVVKNIEYALTDIELRDLVKTLVPIGTIVSGLYVEAPIGYLLCDGSEVNISDYPDLYNVIGNLDICKSSTSGKFKLPDMREVVMVGIGQNENLSIAAHDVYELGEFKDDQFQDHRHSETKLTSVSGGSAKTPFFDFDSTYDNSKGGPVKSGYGRTGTTTHGKQIGVNYIIKAL